jgi:SPP1 family predicted phage head-tail adaptor
MEQPTALKYKIKIVNPTYYDDDEHSSADLKPPDQWEEIAAPLAAYRDLSGNEFFASRQLDSKLTGEFKIRYRPDIKASYKIIWGQRVFDIAGPPRDITGKRLWLFINVEELASMDYFREDEPGV